MLIPTIPERGTLPKDTHYFLTMCHYWVADATLQGAIDKLARCMDGETKREWSVSIVQVALPVTATYDIKYYLPALPASMLRTMHVKMTLGTEE